MLIRVIKTQLQLSDFKAVGVGSGAVSLFREKEETQEQIIISYNKYPGEYRLGPTIAGWKTFSAVEDLVEKYFRRHGIGYHGVTIHCVSRRDEQMFDTSITKTEDVLKILPSLEKMVFEDVMPFFEEYDSLDLVHDEIEDRNISDLAKFVTNPPHLRMMIIKRLLNTSDWELYSEDIIAMYKEQSEGKYQTVFAPIYAFLPALFEELKNIDLSISSRS